MNWPSTTGYEIAETAVQERVSLPDEVVVEAGSRPGRRSSRCRARATTKNSPIIGGSTRSRIRSNRSPMRRSRRSAAGAGRRSLLYCASPRHPLEVGSVVTAPRPDGADRISGVEKSPLSASAVGSGIAILLLVGLLLRLVLAYVLLPGSGFESDIGTFTAWASQLAQTGPGNFYATAGFADYPPGYLYVLWLIGELGNILAPLFGGNDPKPAIVGADQDPADSLRSGHRLRAVPARQGVARRSSRRESPRAHRRGAASSSTPSPGTTRRSGVRPTRSGRSLCCLRRWRPDTRQLRGRCRPRCGGRR